MFFHVAAKDTEIATLKTEMMALKLEKADAREAHAKQLLEAEARGAARAQVCCSYSAAFWARLQTGSTRVAAPLMKVVGSLVTLSGRSQ